MPKIQSTDDLISVEQVAVMVPCSHQTVFDYAKDGRGPKPVFIIIDHHRRTMFRRADAEAWATRMKEARQAREARAETNRKAKAERLTKASELRAQARALRAQAKRLVREGR